MGAKDPFGPLKGNGLPPVPRPVSYNSLGFNPFSELGMPTGDSAGDKDIPDLQYKVLEMDYKNRMLGLGSLGQGVSTTAAALIQSWQDEKARRNK